MGTDLPQLTRPDRIAWSARWLAWLDLSLHREILRLRARYELSMDELRGLYVSDEQVDRLLRRTTPEPELLARIEALDDQRRVLLSEARRGPSPLGNLARLFGLGEPAVLAVLACFAPELDLSYQRLYAYLNDDVGRQLPTVDLCARLAGGAVLRPEDPTLASGLLLAHRVESAPLWRSAGLCLSEPLRRYLYDAPCWRHPHPAARRLIVLDARTEEDALAVAARELGEAEDRLVRPRTLPDGDPVQGLNDAVLTALLEQATLFITAADLGLGYDGRPGPRETALLRQVLAPPLRVVLALPPGLATLLHLDGTDAERVVAHPPDVLERTALWSAALADGGVVVPEEEVAQVAGLFALGRAQITAAARAVSRDPAPDLESLAKAARERSTSGLAEVAQAVPTTFGWDDLVLPAGTRQRVHELAEAVRHRHQVFDNWAFGRLGGGYSSVRALFSGPSGTGKTMSAAVLAGGLGLGLYRVDLSAVVSKYIGETEKNMERILVAAESSNAILLFDEADALFGKRTEIKDAHDRYANIETAFLLQRLESFDGVVILATNLPGNLDEAFGRRIHFQIDFPVPDQALRTRLWQLALPASSPVADDVDPDFLAGMFPMTGGEIRNAALIAAFLAADAGQPIRMTHLVRALARQRRQQGKVPSAAEFGCYLRLVSDGNT